MVINRIGGNFFGPEFFFQVEKIKFSWSDIKVVRSGGLKEFG